MPRLVHSSIDLPHRFPSRAIKGTVCEDCYALKNFYAMPNVQTTLHKRLETAATLNSGPGTTFA
jgi:hypothetical protein